ncbi:hypothetical protein D3C79_632540 [compost metagenome]
MAATGSATRACGRRACRSSFKFGSRVSTGGDGLLQLFNRRGSLGSRCRQISDAVWCVGAPLGIAAQVQGAAVGQFQGYGTCEAGQHLFASEQAVTFDQYAARPFRGYGDNLANNAFDDSNNAAHWTLRYTRSIWLPCQAGAELPLPMECIYRYLTLCFVNFTSITIGY